LLSSHTDGDVASSGSSLDARRDGRGVDVKAKLENLVIPEKNLSCAAHAYKGVYVLSREPLVVYIEGFVSEEEGKEVVALRYVALALISIYDMEEMRFPWELLKQMRFAHHVSKKYKHNCVFQLHLISVSWN
jgi:hypothetical protein